MLRWIEATLEGFRTSIIEGITLAAGATARLDVSLNLGAMTESVSVVAENATVQTEDAKVATNVPNRLIDELPLVVGGAMRSPFDLIATVPEAKGSGTSVQAVNQLLKQFVQTQKMMKTMKKGLFGKGMRGMQLPRMPF